MARTGKVREITEDVVVVVVVVVEGGERDTGRGSEGMIPRQNRPAEVSSEAPR